MVLTNIRKYNQNIITPLCQEIETDLRLHIHTVVLGQQVTHLSALKGNLKDLSIFFKIRPLRFFGAFMEIGSMFFFLKKFYSFYLKS